MLKRPSLRLAAYFKRTAALAAFIGCAFAVLGTTQTQNAVANGDTRTISLLHAHTKETITATFRVNGSYDYATLEKLNWFLRDWRHDEPTKMDPQLFDIIWDAYRQSGSREPIMVMSAYRSPATNAMLRRRSRAVAEHSQHILGKAMDQHYLDVSASRVREIAMKMQRGGVGYYPTAGSPFVHMDVGGVRSWPRMGYDQLARLFPDGKTVHIPANGQPMARYEEARAEIEASGSRYVPVSSIGKPKSFFAALFGGEDEDGGAIVAGPARGRKQPPQSRIQVASAFSGDKDDSRSFFVQQAQSGASAAFEAPAPAKAPAPSRRGRPAIAAEPAAASTVSAAVAETPALPAPAIEAKPKILPPEPAPRPEAPAAAEKPGSDAIEVAALPLPPRRPGTLLAALVATNVPTPPARPAELLARAPAAKADQIASLIASPAGSASADKSAALPEVITRGLTTGKPTPIEALGYAAADPLSTGVIRPTIGVRANPVVASLTSPGAPKSVAATAKIDRAGLRTLTSPQLTLEAPQPSPLGIAAPPLRASVRAQVASLFAAPTPGVALGFGAGPVAPPSDRFAAAD